MSDSKLELEIIKILNQESDLANIYKLTDEERIAVREGLQDVVDGNMHTSESAEKMLEDLLKK